MRKRFAPLALAVVALSTSSCSLFETPLFYFRSPTDGAVLQVGKTVEIEWACNNCESLTGAAEVWLHEPASERWGRIGFGPLSGSIFWTVAPLSASDGIYKLTVTVASGDSPGHAYDARPVVIQIKTK